MFAFTVLLILSLTGVHMATNKRDIRQETEVRLGVTMILDLHYMTHLRHSSHMTRYLKTFLNAVQLRFSDMTDPKIKLILTDVILINAAEQEKLYDKYYVLMNTIYGSWTRSNSEYKFPQNAGIILIMTGFDLWNADPLTGDMTNSGEVNGACTQNKKNIALSEDDGLTFSGVGSAAQAIARLLGASFDIDRPSGECSRDKGYLLSSNYTGVSARYNLSDCGKNEIKKAINASDKTRKNCFFGEPTIQSSVSQVKESQELPIDFYNYTNPCNLVYGSPSCKVGALVCYLNKAAYPAKHSSFIWRGTLLTGKMRPDACK
uniref:Putative secreted metalloprotease n=1 Tax=Ixodes ricinus TaxID=34613 RepID=A0A6B0V933_IXORI